MTPRWPSRVLCPVDFSEPSGAALRYAKLLSEATPGALTVLHTHSWEAPAYFTESQLGALKQQFERSLSDADGALERFIAQECPGCDASRMILDAAPVDGILRAAREKGADVLVMGTHGRSGLNRFLLGSVTERVLREATIPVLTVRSGMSAAEGTGGIAKILCPVNDSPVARQALQTAANLASLLRAELTVLHVEEPHRAVSAPDACQWLSADQRAECKVQQVKSHGEAVEETLKLAGEMGADLLVIGARHRAFHDTTVLGTTSIRVIRHSPVPVLTVFDGPDA